MTTYEIDANHLNNDLQHDAMIDYKQMRHYADLLRILEYLENV